MSKTQGARNLTRSWRGTVTTADGPVPLTEDAGLRSVTAGVKGRKQFAAKVAVQVAAAAHANEQIVLEHYAVEFLSEGEVIVTKQLCQCAPGNAGIASDAGLTTGQDSTYHAQGDGLIRGAVVIDAGEGNLTARLVSAGTLESSYAPGANTTVAVFLEIVEKRSS